MTVTWTDATGATQTKRFADKTQAASFVVALRRQGLAAVRH